MAVDLTIRPTQKPPAYIFEATYHYPEKLFRMPQRTTFHL
jgi:hypothetical protein